MRHIVASAKENCVIIDVGHMCGIVGITSKNPVPVREFLSSLKRMDYRGYDSYGFVTDSVGVKKKVGEISVEEDGMMACGISHCRWATHGGVTKENAHPHADCAESLFAVHNGIIDNYQELKDELIKKGHKFRSETDSEVIAHFFEERGKEGKKTGEAAEEFFRRAKGEFAILLMRKGEHKLHALKRGSPLVLGIADGMNMIASDIYAFSGKTNKAVFLNEDEFAVVSPGAYELYRYDYSVNRLVPQSRNFETFEWQKSEEKHEYEHYMLKEIMEEPVVAGRLLDSLEHGQKEKLLEFKKMIEAAKRIVFVASGTSYHASLLGVYFLNKAGIEAHTIIASEFKNFTLLGKDTLAIAVSQSGETMDVIEALHGIKAKGVKIASLVNVPYSTVQRMSNVSVNIMAGQEVCVAATKTFVNQVIALLYLASLFGYDSELKRFPSLIEQLLNQNEKIKSIASRLKGCKDIYIIGRGFSYPVAREIALKMKEIPYIHAEGMMAGELKHGTLALIEKGTPVIALMPKGDQHILSNAKEVEARGASVIAVSENNHENYETIRIPAEGKASFSVLAAIVGQLLTYYIAKENGLPIDKPRNLAKCCTTR